MIEIVKQDDFERLKSNHDKLMENNEDYRRVYQSTTFSVGKKIDLSIEVTDEYLSGVIIAMLHGKIKGMELLGFKVNEISFHPQDKVKNEVRKTLEKMIANVDDYCN